MRLLGDVNIELCLFVVKHKSQQCINLAGVNNKLSLFVMIDDRCQRYSDEG